MVWFFFGGAWEAALAAISGLAALVLALGTPASGGAPQEPSDVVAASNSLAVLPLRSLGSDSEGEFFAEGITEDIISYLAQLRGLRVISRTSSMRFRGSDLSIGEIAAQLRVRHVLEGSVRRQGDSLRVSTQLVDAATDDHLWLKPSIVRGLMCLPCKARSPRVLPRHFT